MNIDAANHAILVIDDERAIREALERVLIREGYQVWGAANVEEAEKILTETNISLALTDLMMPVVDGMELLRRIKKRNAEIEVVLITGHATVERAVEAMKEGAYDFITKPFKRAEILGIINKALEKVNLLQENRALKEQLAEVQSFSNDFIGRSQQVQDVLRMVDRVAPLNSTVLVNGESGTGKEIVTRMIHAKSPRANKRLVAVNCGAISENLVESELFGHVKGAFTGAIRDKDGLFKIASGGTLFLDEINSIPLNLQVKLLRALESHEIMPVGSTKSIAIDTRIIAASNRNLAKDVEEGRFRDDLFYRLNIVDINIPPLRKRTQDIHLLSDHFIKKLNKDLKKKISGIHPDTLQVFLAYEWKGNVRELENVIERAMILCDGDLITPEYLPHHLVPQGHITISKNGLKDAVAEFEKKHILNTLTKTNGDKKSAAKLLDLSLSSLYRKMTELGIEAKMDDPQKNM